MKERPPSPEGGTALVVVAHGSRAAASNDAHLATAAALDQLVPAQVVAGFLELAEPSIGDAIDAVVVSGATSVLVLPHFLYPGRHLTEDIPAIVAAAGERHPGTAIRLLPASGSGPAMLALLADQVRKELAASGPDYSTIV